MVHEFIDLPAWSGQKSETERIFIGGPNRFEAAAAALRSTTVRPAPLRPLEKREQPIETATPFVPPRLVPAEVGVAWRPTPSAPAPAKRRTLWPFGK